MGFRCRTYARSAAFAGSFCSKSGSFVVALGVWWLRCFECSSQSIRPKLHGMDVNVKNDQVPNSKIPPRPHDEDRVNGTDTNGHQSWPLYYGIIRVRGTK